MTLREEINEAIYRAEDGTYDVNDLTTEIIDLFREAMLSDDVMTSLQNVDVDKTDWDKAGKPRIRRAYDLHSDTPRVVMDLSQPFAFAVRRVLDDLTGEKT